jgi:hypothetical protein
LIKKYAQEYDIDYFLYFIDPQKDPGAVSGEWDIGKYGPKLIVEGEEVKEELNFVKGNFVSEKYKTFKTYQFLRNFYYQIKKTENNNVFGEQTQPVAGSYPDIYFDKPSTEMLDLNRKMGKIMDYIAQNSKPMVYFIFMPSQQTYMIKDYEENKNINQSLANQKFVDFMTNYHRTTKEKLTEAWLSVFERIKNNHVEPKNLPLRLKETMNNKERIIDITDQLLNFVNEDGSDGYLYNWHRRDSGQKYLAEILKEGVLPEILLSRP